MANIILPSWLITGCVLLLVVLTAFAANEGGDDAEKKKKEEVQAKVKPLLEKNRQTMKAELAKLAEKQKEDKEFQKLLKEVMAARGKHPNEQKEGPVKRIAQLNADILGETYQGDIRLNEEQARALDVDVGGEGNGTESGGRRRRRGAAMNTAYYTTSQWPDAIVPYVFASDVPAATQQLIQKAMNIWQTNSCVTFQQNAAATNKLLFTTAYSGCWSYVGRQDSWSEQEVNIGSGCEYVGIIAHEIGHALGFFHEQSRYDRDNFVIYNAANVQVGMESNFDKETTTTNNNYGHTYDYGSVMHYADTDFSANGQPVLVARLGPQWQQTMGQAIAPSFYDIKMMNSLYNCKARCTNAITCLSGSIQNSRNCSACLCPPGLGGCKCDQQIPPPINAGYAPSGVANTCTGQHIKALATASELTGQIGTTNTAAQPYQSDSAWCHWHIYADAGYKIAIEVLEVGNYCSKGCFYGNTEIRVGDALDQSGSIDWGRTGVRLCCTSDLGTTGTLTLSTGSNHAMISLYASYYVQRFRIRYWQYAASG